MTVQLVTTSGKNTAFEVSADVFGAKPNKILLAQAEYVYQSNQRQGSSMVKTRGEINRTKKKWYKQKGTGGARHGARTPSIFVGGGVAHGPTGLNDWTRTLTKNQRRKALIYALSMKAQDESLMVSDEIEAVSAKTKATAALVSKVAGDKRVLIIIDQSIANLLRSTRNISNVLVTRADRLNVHEVMLANKILITKAAVKALEIKLSGDEKAKPEVETKAVAAPVATKSAAKPVAKKAAVKPAAKVAKPAAKAVKAPAKKTAVKKAK